MGLRSAGALSIASGHRRVAAAMAARRDRGRVRLPLRINADVKPEIARAIATDERTRRVSVGAHLFQKRTDSGESLAELAGAHDHAGAAGSRRAPRGAAQRAPSINACQRRSRIRALALSELAASGGRDSPD
jgi:hypothetical protein